MVYYIYIKIKTFISGEAIIVFTKTCFQKFGKLVNFDENFRKSISNRQTRNKKRLSKNNFTKLY